MVFADPKYSKSEQHAYAISFCFKEPPSLFITMGSRYWAESPHKVCHVFRLLTKQYDYSQVNFDGLPLK